MNRQLFHLTCTLLFLGISAMPHLARAQNNAPSTQLPPPTTTTVAPDARPQVREYDQNGIRYRETRQVVAEPVRDVRYVDQTQTYYTQRYRTDMQNRTVSRLVPTTQYECVARLHDWWRIFGQPYVAYHNEPYTTWSRTAEIQPVPVTRREVVPQQRTVKVAVPYLRMEPRVRTSRVALGPTPLPRQIAAAPAAAPSPAPNPLPPTPTPQTTPTYNPPTQVAQTQAPAATRPLPQLPPANTTTLPPGPPPQYAQPQSTRTPLPAQNLPQVGQSPPRVRPPGYIPPNATRTQQPPSYADPYSSSRGFPTSTGPRSSRTPGFVNPNRGFGQFGSAQSGAQSNTNVQQPYNWPANSRQPTPNLTPPVRNADRRYGGVARMDGDPPRFGTTMSNDTTFQARRQ